MNVYVSHQSTNSLVELPTQCCCVCDQQAWIEQFTAVDCMHGLPGIWQVWRCAGCQTRLTDPLPEDIARYYPQGYYTYQQPHVPHASKQLRWLYQTVGQFWPLCVFTRLRFGPGPTPRWVPAGSLLDVGCGSGQWLGKMAALGWTVRGIEPSAHAVQAAQAAGLNVQQGVIEDVQDALFDVIRLWHVLEHVPDPRATLEHAYRLLKPGGRLIIGVPNGAGWLAKMAGSSWFDLDAPRHRWHWNAASLQVLVERAGLRKVKVGFGYYGGLPSLRSLMYWRSRHNHAQQGWLKWLARLRKVVPLHGIVVLLEWNNYLELEAYRD